jgi:hypothetical protein
MYFCVDIFPAVIVREAKMLFPKGLIIFGYDRKA